MRYWTCVLALTLLTVTTATQAETWEGRWGLGVHGGVWKQVGGDADYSGFGPATGIELGYGLTDALTLDFGFSYGWARPGVYLITEEAGLTFDAYTRLYTRIWQPSLSLKYRLVPEGTWRPWISAGAGFTRWDLRDLTGESAGLYPDGTSVNVVDENGMSAAGHGAHLTGMVGMGTEIAASDHVSFDLGVRFHYWVGNDRDSVGLSSIAANAPGGVDVNFGLIEGLVGVKFAFGTTDSDGDGIANNIDADPDHPEDFDGFQDGDGAPDLDNDGDGILDEVDGAPNDAEDIDGYEDTDGVPDLDNDGDGILDVDDADPNHAEDVDGFQDDDGAPDPDNDGDGVLDAADECPTTPPDVEVDARGCPLAEEIRQDLVLAGVEFKTSSADLTPESLVVLRQVAESLRAWPEVNVEIAGHSDSRGAAEFNQSLSQQRAESVRMFLINAGIDADRITAVGYGEYRPIADNSTPEGRAINRRVELHRMN